MEWRKIAGRQNYSVNDCGDIRNDKTGRILKLHLGTAGYYQVMLGRKTVPLYVHRLVASAFLDNPSNLPQVDHINGDKTDNRAENLRWVSVSENCWSFGYAERIEHRKKRIKATSKDGVLLFNSRDDAAKYFGVTKSRIRYDRELTKGNMRGWTFEIVDDIV